MARRSLSILAVFLFILGLSPARATTFDVRVLVLMINFSNDTSQPYQVSLPQGVMFTNANSVRQYWLDSTAGQVQVTGEVHGWYTIPDTNEGCDFRTWEPQARAAATADGVNVAAFTHIIYAVTQGNCGFLGNAGGSLTRGSMDINAGFGQGTVLHESIHMLGVLLHPGLIDYVGGPIYGGDFYTGFYGSQWTASGGDMELMDRQVPAALVNAADISVSGTYVLPDLSTASILRIPLTSWNGELSSELVLDYRARTIAPWTDYPLSGVTVRYLTLIPSATLNLIRTGPCGDYVLRNQQQWYDATARTLIRVDSLTSSAATITVTLNADAPIVGPDTIPPTIPVGLTAKRQGKNVNLAWNPSTDDRDCQPSYRVFRNGVQIASVSSTSLTDLNVPRRTTLTYRVAALDSAGNVSGQSASVTV